MALSESSWLNHYEILGHLGTGGMGEVYRARDNKLQREVALKVLPKAFAQDPERVARFRREAQVLAQLNHTNIAAIYSVEQSGETHFLVMELAEGETLRERIKRGPVPVEEVLDIAKQIAAGLECAHEKPIVHRDLKPANVKVTPEGVVKILDFGLARAFAGDSASSDPADSPTLTGMTQPGTILGTAAYMSPEQARGKKVDKRTDIWALGCVLFEMLTGKQAFAGEDVTDILAAVVRGEPDWDALPESTPPGVSRLLRRCLQKNRDQRLRDAGDLRMEIEETFREPEAAQVAVTAQRERERPQARMPVLLAGALLIAAVASVATWNLVRSGPGEPAPTKRFAIGVPESEQLVNQGLALSPDGKTLVYVGARDGIVQLYRRSMDQLEAVPMEGTENASIPFFSPDSQWVGFFADGALKKVALAGGPAATVCDIQGLRYGGSWGADDTIVLSFSGSPLLRVPAAGGVPQPLATLSQGEVDHRWPDILPGGKAVLFTSWTGGLENTSIAVQPIEGGEHRILLNGTNPRFVPTGHIVFLRSDGSLWAVPFDEERLEVSGSPAPLIEDIQLNSGGLGHLALAGDGSLVYMPGIASSTMQLTWVDRKGVSVPLNAPLSGYATPRVSPDGQRIALDNIGDISVYELARGTLSRLSFDPSNDETPAWTPDGKRVAYASDRDGTRKLLSKAADGSGEEEELFSFPGDHVHIGSWSPDGQHLAIEKRSSGGVHIAVLFLSGDRKETPFAQTQFFEGSPAFSPDGKWIAYQSNESGRPEVYVQPFPGPGGKWQVSTGGGSYPVWAHSGRELFYVSGDRMMAADITTQPSFSPGPPRPLFELRSVPNQNFQRDYDVAPDDQRFLMIDRVGGGGGLSQINVVLNWFEELKRRVPVK